MLHNAFNIIKRHTHPRVARFMRRWATAFVTPVRFSVLRGHARSSLAELAVDRRGAPLPWYTYPAIDFLDARNFSGRSVLEFGGGQSTLWWQERAERVVTIEGDEAWAGQLQARSTGKVTVLHVPVDEERRDISAVIEAISQTGHETFDLVVIDGHLREELARIATRYLKRDGAVIMDNSEGYEFFEATRKSGMLRADFYGFAPGVSLQHCTSILFNPACFLFDVAIEIRKID
ncbi:O-methyltransferase [Alsobacter sp. R-9]